MKGLRTVVQLDQMERCVMVESEMVDEKKNLI